MFPASMLSRLYVKGSLKNVADGVEFTLNNTLDYATLVGVGPVIVAGRTYEAPSIRIAIGEKAWRGDQISYSNPVAARMFVPIRITLEGEPLPEGEHLVIVAVTTQEIGRVKFDFKDSVAGAETGAA